MARRQQHIGSTRRLPQDFAAQGIIGLLVNVAAGGQVAPISLALIIAICGEVDRQVGCKGCVQVPADRKSVVKGKSVSVSVDLGVSSIDNKKNRNDKCMNPNSVRRTDQP